MKKILSTLLVAAMLLSLVIVVAVPASAVDGAWDSMGSAKQYAEGYDGDPVSVPGYEYTDDGLHMVPADWSTFTPFGTVQTKEKVDLKDGVYMLVRVDNFTYSGDKWFNINIWDSVNICPGEQTFGAGLQTLIRPSDAPAEGKPGSINEVQWFHGPFTHGGNSTMATDATKADDNGCPLMALTITWDGTTYSVEINGAKAPQASIDFMNQKWGGADSEAYIGFTLQNSNKGGTVEATILKFGTSAETATVPMGDDSKDSEDYTNVFAEIADPSTVPEGQPAIIMTGDKTNSHTKFLPRSGTGATISINDDFTVHIVAQNANTDTGAWMVKNDVSYAIEDFPVAICLTKNLCTCGDEECYALESCNVYLMVGDNIQPQDNYKVTELDMSYDPYIIENGDGTTDSYLLFFCDMSADYAPFVASGRINGTRFDITGIDTSTPGKNAFDICMVAFFRNAEEAQAYVEAYIGYDAEPDTTEEPTTVVQDTTAEETTIEADATTEEVEDTTEKKTEEKTEDKTEAPAENKGGCGSVVGFSAIAVIAMAAAGVVSFKKRH